MKMSKNFNPTYHEFARGVLRAPKMGDGRWEMGSLEGVRLKVEGGNGLGMGGDS